MIISAANKCKFARLIEHGIARYFTSLNTRMKQYGIRDKLMKVGRNCCCREQNQAGMMIKMMLVTAVDILAP
jgi:hypothetical protein